MRLADDLLILELDLAIELLLETRFNHHVLLLVEWVSEGLFRRIGSCNLVAELRLNLHLDSL